MIVRKIINYADKLICHGGHGKQNLYHKIIKEASDISVTISDLSLHF